MFLLLRRLLFGRVISGMSSHYSRLPLVLAALGLARAILRRRASRSAVIQLKKDERLVVTRVVDRV